MRLPSLLCSGLQRCWYSFDWLAQRRALAVILVGGLAVVLAIALSLVTFVPIPVVHDEFSYLLAADTFAHGRLTNPTHPMWVHFESFHIFHEPTYMSKYPPAQGVILALGERLGGHPIVGVWLSVGLACAALTWMLQGWLPPRWALLGGLLAATHQGIIVQWSHNNIGGAYWGGQMAMLGGALLFGSLRRLIDRPTVPLALTLALGLVVLANSRPFEGLVVSLPAALVLGGWLVSKGRPPLRVALTRVVMPIALALAIAAGGMGYYNFVITGRPLLMPYTVHEQNYARTSTFLLLGEKPEPAYHHKVMRDYWRGFEAGRYRAQTETLALWLDQLWERKIRVLGGFYLGYTLVLPLLVLPWALRDRWVRFAVLTCGLLGLVFLNHVFVFPHYAAPMTCLLFFLVVVSLRRLYQVCPRGWRVGPLLVGLVLAAYLVADARAYAIAVRRLNDLAGLEQALAEGRPPYPIDVTQVRRKYFVAALRRVRLLEQLRQTEGQHLVIVRYRPEHWYHFEWVYNEADIDGAKVVWAREMDPAQNRDLLAYFRGRRAWLLDADVPSPQLVPYPAPGVDYQGRQLPDGQEARSSWGTPAK
jgi:hypothetical protein